MAPVSIGQEKLAAFCRKHHVGRLEYFGTTLHGYSTADNDLDVLVEFEPDHVSGLAFFAMEAELSELLRREVDLNTPAFSVPTSASRR